MDTEPKEEPPFVKEAEFRTTNLAVKVDVDQDDVGIYKYFDSCTSTVIYYKCLDPRPNELTDEKILYTYVMEVRMGQAIMMMDKYQRRYKKVRIEELMDVTIMGHPANVVLRPIQESTR